MKMKPDFFVANRARLAQELSGGLIVVTAYDEMQRANDMAHPYEQEANMWYLCGVEASRWKLVIDGQRHHSWLVEPAMSDVERIFDGGADPAAIRMTSGVDEVITHDEFEPLLRQLLRRHSTVYTVQSIGLEHVSFTLNPAQRQLTHILERIFSSVVDCQLELSRLRAIKQPVEIAAMQRAITLTTESFELMRDIRQDSNYEYQLEAVMTGNFRQHNAYHAYDPIVASGAHACTLHYGANNGKLTKRQLVLLDVGARVDGYAADISRTYAIGTPTQRQRAVHQALEQAQRDIIKLLGPHLSVSDYQREVDSIMTATLLSLGLDAGTPEQTLRTYMPHAIGHGIGIDVHESLGRTRTLEAGMTLTVEPGIYIPEEGIGARIEDDILITNSGRRNMSRALSTALD